MARARGPRSLKTHPRAVARPVLLWVVIACLAAPAAVQATGNDRQVWPLARATYGLGEQWQVALTARGRWNDDLADHRDYLLRPYVTWTPVAGLPLVDSASVLAGYDYLSVNNGRDEHRAWQALSHTPTRGVFGFVHRVRMDERWIDGLDKVIWRFRYRLSTTYQIAESSWYGRFSDEVFANLNDEDEGPVGGFEDNRARVALGSYLTDRLRLEGGYQFEYARRRGRTNEFRHTLFIELTLAAGRLRVFEHRKEVPVGTTIEAEPETSPGTPGG